MTKGELIKAREWMDNMEASPIVHNGGTADILRTTIKALDAQIKACDDRAEPVNRQMYEALLEIRYKAESHLRCWDDEAGYMADIDLIVKKAINAAEQQLEKGNG